MNYDFLVSTYRTERLKVLSVWSMFRDEDMDVRLHPTDTRGRSVREQMIHQCLSEDLWFRTFFGIDLGADVLYAALPPRSNSAICGWLPVSPKHSPAFQANRQPSDTLGVRVLGPFMRRTDSHRPAVALASQ
jgi:hypothetical protein